MDGNLAFTRPSTASTASVVNRSRITVKQGGLSALVAPVVVNDGVIRARLGKAVLAAGETFTLDLAGDRLINFAVDSKVLNRVTAPDGTPLSAAIANSGRIIADGGVIEISVDAAKGVVDRAISMTGIAEARSVHRQPGAIVLDGGDAGNVHLAGRLDASGNRPGEIGGAIAVTGRDVALHGAVLDASGTAGGCTIAVGGSAHGAGPLRNAARTSIDRASVLHADAGSTGNGGSVTVWSERHTRFNGAISARGGPSGPTGGNGGAAEVSSHGVVDFNGTADLRAPSGTAGTLLLDPNDVVIQSAGTSTRPLIGTSVLTVGNLETELAQGNVTVTTGLPAIGTQAGDITVANDIAWSSGNTLSLSANHDIAVNAKLSSTNSGGVVLRADNTGTGSGTIAFGVGGAIEASGGAVSLTFNSIDPSYKATQNYAGKVTLSGGAALTQFVLVNTVTDLASINNNLTGLYALGRDIDAGAIANFAMIGVAAPFSGVFDGQNHIIDKLSITSDNDNVGLFGQTGGGSTVRNVGLTGISVAATKDNSNVGGLAGLAAGAIVNAYTTGAVTAPAGANALGGLVGQTAGNGSVAQSFSGATVTGGQQTGGLAGFVGAANSITGSFATGAVSATDNTVGGLVGHNEGTIANSYATGAVTGGTAGGLIGKDLGGLVLLSQVYGAGAVTGTTSSTGGLVGQHSSSSTATAAYWDMTATGQASARGTGSDPGATGLTTAQLQSGTLPAGFAPSIWRAKMGSYPTVLGPAQTVTGTVFSSPGGLPLSGATVRLLVDGVDQGVSSRTTAGGFYGFPLPGSTIAPTGGEVLAVVTGGGSGNAFFDGATGSRAIAESW